MGIAATASLLDESRVFCFKHPSNPL
ncbi:hypothetical protein BN1263530026 [Stenotrophomonas indicatrix]|nr:hypothetical protein BN1263530026 [Stenotrophomonas indicatrix]